VPVINFIGGKQVTRKNFQLRVREEDENKKQKVYSFLDFYRAQHRDRLRSSFDALYEIVVQRMTGEAANHAAQLPDNSPNFDPTERPHGALPL
jgi:hypothetical protein